MICAYRYTHDYHAVTSLVIKLLTIPLCIVPRPTYIAAVIGWMRTVRNAEPGDPGKSRDRLVNNCDRSASGELYQSIKQASKSNQINFIDNSLSSCSSLWDRLVRCVAETEYECAVRCYTVLAVTLKFVVVLEDQFTSLCPCPRTSSP